MKSLTKFLIALSYWASGFYMVAMIINIAEGNTVWAVIMGICTIFNLLLPTLYGLWEEVE